MALFRVSITYLAYYYHEKSFQQVADLANSNIIDYHKTTRKAVRLAPQVDIFNQFAAVAEFERNLIRERTKAGLNAARARGRLGGRPKALDKNKQAIAVTLYDEKKHSIDDICKTLGVSKPTLYKYIKASRESMV